VRARGEAVTAPSWLWPLLAAPFAGSLLGVLIRRLPAGRPVAMARSACETCGATLGPRDLVPLASFLALRGRCRSCGAPIGWFHPAVELAALAVAAWSVAADADASLIWADCALGWTLLALAWIDVETFLLPDALTLPLILAGLAFTWFAAPDALADAAIGAAAGYASLRLVAWTYRRLRGREGLGAGDAKLFAAAGAWVGWPGLPQVLLAASVAGLALVLLQAAAGRRIDRATAVPFGPPLALGTWLVWLHGAG
jgi:leader peptidase (prepilin peptidase)/N-methyltransferase